MRQRRVLLLGAAGQVGKELELCFQDAHLTALNRRQADLSQPETLRAVVRAVRPDVILNAAAYTAVDQAETEADIADRVNHLAPRVLAEEAEMARSLLVSYSTDYVFDGSKREPWVETDAPRPLNVYGASKLAGEHAIQAACRRHIILRTSWVYAPHGKNFLQTMLRLGRERKTLCVVNDQWGAPTTAATLAAATRVVVNNVLPWGEHADLKLGYEADAPESWAGIYHATCAGQTSWCGFAEAIFAAVAEQQSHAWPHIEGVTSDLYPTLAKRPQNSVLSNRKLADRFGVRLPLWEDALASLQLLQRKSLSDEAVFLREALRQS